VGLSWLFCLTHHLIPNRFPVVGGLGEEFFEDPVRYSIVLDYLEFGVLDAFSSNGRKGVGNE
jgi:hypothetical protein